MPSSTPLLSAIVSQMQRQQPTQAPTRAAGGGMLSQLARAVQLPRGGNDIGPVGNVPLPGGGAPRAPLAPVPPSAMAAGGAAKKSGPVRMSKPSAPGAPPPNAPSSGMPSLPPLTLPSVSSDFFAGMKRPNSEATARQTVSRPSGGIPYWKFPDGDPRAVNSPVLDGIEPGLEGGRRIPNRGGGAVSRVASGGGNALSDVGGMLDPRMTRGR